MADQFRYLKFLGIKFDRLLVVSPSMLNMRREGSAKAECTWQIEWINLDRMKACDNCVFSGYNQWFCIEVTHGSQAAVNQPKQWLIGIMDSLLRGKENIDGDIEHLNDHNVMTLDWMKKIDCVA